MRSTSGASAPPAEDSAQDAAGEAALIAVLANPDLSWAAKGVYAYLVKAVGDNAPAPDVHRLMANGPQGKQAVRNVVQELVDAGLADYQQVRVGGRYRAQIRVRHLGDTPHPDGSVAQDTLAG
ncbi:hypothetical protein [Saccharothrix hoggarensis]|uniref:Helix-turn-helix protein n=1 Tax=Saccharothrix hoggarensis TaxID=913853 RepID=A0ABW3QIM1_9PSEU